MKTNLLWPFKVIARPDLNTDNLHYHCNTSLRIYIKINLLKNISILYSLWIHNLLLTETRFLPCSSQQTMWEKIRTPLEQPHFTSAEMALRRATPPDSRTTPEQFAPW
jgi:hypothetical protein